MSQQNKKLQNVKRSQPFKKAEIIQVDNDVKGVVCDGGIGGLGHPQVWYGFDNGYNHDHVSCYYCGRRFVKNLD